MNSQRVVRPISLVIACLLTGPPNWALAQEQEQLVRSIVPYRQREVSLRIRPDANFRYSKSKFVRVRSATGTPQVARLVCFADEDAIIERPSGELAMVPQAEIQPSDSSKMSKVTQKDVNNSLRQVGIEGYKQVFDKPYLFVYDCSDAFLDYTRTIIKSMYPGVCKQLIDWGLDVRRPDVPLIVVITPNRKAFDELDRMPPEVAAYYNVLSNHVVLYEDQELADAAPEFALKQAAYTIVHEGVHQLLANTGVQQRLSRWPMWISEGVPEYLCPLRVKSEVVKRKSAQLPVRDVRWIESGMLNDLRMYSLLKIRGGRGEVIEKTAGAKELDADGYAVAWGMVHHLAKNEPDALKAYLKDVSKMRAFAHRKPETQKVVHELFGKHFSTNYRGLERDIQRHLTSKEMQKDYKDPIANQTRYLVKLVWRRGKRVLNAAMITTSPASAREWKEEQEKQYPKASFYTVICENQRRADYEWRKFIGG